MAALGELICRLNPYTELPFDKTANMQTGKMEVGTLPKPTGNYAVNDPHINTIACIEIEVEKNYGAKWTFKGQTQSVKAVRPSLTVSRSRTSRASTPIGRRNSCWLVGGAEGGGKHRAGRRIGPLGRAALVAAPAPVAIAGLIPGCAYLLRNGSLL